MIYQRDSIDGVLQATEDTLISICSKYGKAYCYPSQKTIMRLLDEYHGIKIGRRTLNRVLRWLENHGSFKRTKRHRDRGDGRMVFATTMYELKKKLFIRLNLLKKWVDRVSSPLRVSTRAQYRSIKKNEIFKTSAADVDIVWKSPIEGKPSPVSFHGRWH